MADRYWVGGTGTWDTTTTHWSATSGGAAGATVPTAADNVIFDANSGSSFTVTINTAARTCLNLTVASDVSGMTLAGTQTLTISGSLSLPASGLTLTYSGSTTMSSTAATSITTNGVTLTFPLTLAGSGTKSLLTAVTMTGTLTHSAGTLSLGTYTLTCAAYSSSNSTTRSITYGSGSSIVLTGSGTVWTTATATGFTSTGTSNVRLTNSGAVATAISAGAVALANSQNFYITAGTYSLSISGNINNLDFTGFSGTHAQSSNAVSLYGSLVYSATMSTSTTSGAITLANTSGTTTITTNGITVNNSFNRNGAGGTTQLLDNFTQGSTSSFTLTNGTLDLNNLSTTIGILVLITGTRSYINGTINCTSVTHTSGALTLTSTAKLIASGTYTFTAGTITIPDGEVLQIGAFSSSGSGVRSIAYNTTGELRITGSGTVWNTATVTSFTYTGTSRVRFTYAGSVACTITAGSFTSTYAPNFYITAGTYSLTISGSIDDLDFTGFSGTYAQAANTITLYGNLVFSSTMATSTTTGIISMSGTAQSITSNGEVLACNITAASGTVTIADTFAQTSTSTLTIGNGSVNFNSQTYTLGILSFAAGTGVISNYGASITCVSLIQARALTVGSGGYIINTGTHTLTSGTLTIAAGYTHSVSALSSNNSNTRAIAFGAGSILELTGSGTVIDFGTATVTGFSYSGTSNVTLNYSGASTVNISTGSMNAAQSMNFYVVGGTHTITYSTSAFNNLDFTGFSGTFTQTTNGCDVFGNLTFSATMATSFTNSVSGSLRMAATSGVDLITTNGITVNLNIYFTGAGGTTRFADSFIQNSAARFAISSTNIVDFNNQTYSIGQLYINTASPSYINYGGLLTPASVYQNSGTVTIGTGAVLSTTGSYELFAGTITINNGLTLSVGSFISNNTNTRVLAFGTGNITTTGTGAVWNVTAVTGLTFTGTSNVIINNPTATASNITSTGNSTTALNFSIVSGTYTLTMGTGSVFRELNFTGFTGTLSLAATAHTIYANLTLDAGMTSSATAGTGSFTWNSTAGTRTITTNGSVVNFGITMNGVGQTLQLADAFVQGSTQVFNYISGTLDLNSYSTAFGSFVISNGTHAFVNGTITAASVTHSSGALAIGTGYLLDCTGTYTFTAGSITINDGVSLLVGAMSSANTGTRSIAFGTGSIVADGASGGTLWNVTGVTGLTFTGTSNVIINSATSNTVTVTNTSTASNPFNFSFVGSYPLTLTTGGSYNNLDFTSYTGTIGFVATTHTVYGNLVLGASTLSTATAGTNTLTWVSTVGTRTITTNGATVGFGIRVNGVGQVLQLADNFTQGSTQVFGLTAGTIDLNSKTVSAGVLTVVTGTHALTNGTLVCASVTHTSGDLAIGTGYSVECSGTYTLTAGSITINDGVTLKTAVLSSNNTNTRSIAFGTGIIELTGNAATILNLATTTGFTVTGTANIVASYAGSTGTRTLNTGTGITGGAGFRISITAGSDTVAFTTSMATSTINFTGFSGTWSNVAFSCYGSITLSPTMTAGSGANAVSFIYTTGTRTFTSNGVTVDFPITLSNSIGTIFQFTDTFVQGSTRAFTITNGTVDVNAQSVTVGNFTINAGTHDIANGTLNCASVTHTSGDLSVGIGYGIVCAGSYTFTAGTINIADGSTLSVGSFISSNSNARSIAYNITGTLEITGSGTVWSTTTVTNFAYTGTSNVRLIYSGASAVTITSGAMSAAQAQNFYITSGSYTLTTTTGSTFSTLDFTGFSGTYAQAATNVSLYGNLVFSSTMATSTTTGILSMASTSGTKTVTTNGLTVTTNINFNGVGGTFQLADTFSQSPTASFILTNGTVDFNSQTYTLGILTFVSGTRSYINYGSNLVGSSILHTSGTVSLDTGALVSTPGSYTFTAGTITINSGVTLSVGSFISTNTNTRVIGFGTGSITTTGSGSVWNVTAVTGLTYTGTGIINIDNPTTTSASITNTATTASAFNFNIVSGTYTLTFTTGNSYNNLNFTGFTGLVAFGSSTHTMYGNLVLGSGMTSSATAGTSTLTWNSTSGTRTIISNGATADFGIALNGVGQTLQLADAFVQGSAQTFAYTNGTIDVNGYSNLFGVFTISSGTHAISAGTVTAASVLHSSGDLTVNTTSTLVAVGTYTYTAGTINIGDGSTLSVGSFSSSNSNARSIAYNTSGVLALTGSGTVWSTTTTTNFSYTGTSKVNLVYSGSATTTIATGSMTLAQAQNFYITSGSYNLSIATGSVLNTIDFTGFAGVFTQGADIVTVYNNIVFSNTMSYTTSSGYLSMAATSGTKTVTTNGSTVGCSINFNGVGGTFQLADNFNQSTTASFILTNGTVDFNSVIYSLGILTFVSGTRSYINYGGTLSGASIVHQSGTVTIGTGATVTTTGSYTFVSGTITINNSLHLTVGSFISVNTNTRSISYSGGSITTTGYGTVWNVDSTTGWGTNPSDSLIRISNTTSNPVTVTNVESATANTSKRNFSFIDGSYTLTLTSGNSYRNLNFSGFSGTIAFGSTTHTVYGGTITLGASTLSTATPGVNNIRLVSTSAINPYSNISFITNGSTVNFGIDLNDCYLVLASALTQGALYNMTVSTQYSGIDFTSSGIANASTLGTLVVNNAIGNLFNTRTGTIRCAYVNQNADITLATNLRIYCLNTYTHVSGTLALGDSTTGRYMEIGNYVQTSTATLSFPASNSRIGLTGVGRVWQDTTSLSFSGSPLIVIYSNTTSDVSILTYKGTPFYVGTNSNFNLLLEDGSTIGALYCSYSGVSFTGTLQIGSVGCKIQTLTLVNTMAGTSSSGGTLTMYYYGSTITSAGITINFNIACEMPYGTDPLTITGNLTISPSYSFKLIKGRVLLGNYILTAGCLDITTTNSYFDKTISFGTGYIILTGTSGAVITSTDSSFLGTPIVYLQSSATSGTTLTVGLGSSDSSASGIYLTIVSGSYTLQAVPLTYSKVESLYFDTFSGTFNSEYYMEIKRDFNLSSGMTVTGAGTFDFTGTSTISGSGVPITQRIVFTSGGKTLSSALSISNSSGITHISGNLLTNNYSLTTPVYTIQSGSKTLTLGSSTITITGAGWDVVSATGLTVTAGTSSIVLTSSSSKIFNGGSKTYYILTQGGAGALTVSGNNTFNDIRNTYQPATVTLTSGSTQTVSNFTMSGTPGNLISLNATTLGSPATLSKSSGTVNVSYMNITDSTATGGATWNSPTSSGNVDGGGNLGWLFGAIVSTVLGNFFAFF